MVNKYSRLIKIRRNAFILRKIFFNVGFYKNNYNDLKHLNAHQLIKHYLYKGKKQGRVVSVKHAKLLTKNSEFDIQFYKKYNCLKHMNPHQLVKHYLNIGRNKNFFVNKVQSEINVQDLIKKYNINLEYLSRFNNINFQNHIDNNNDNSIITNINKILLQNQTYLSYDICIPNLHTNFKKGSGWYNKFYDRKIYTKNLHNYCDLLNYNNKFVKPFNIYNKETFYSYYKDFNYDFYKLNYSIINRDEIDILHYYHTNCKMKKLLYNEKHLIVIYTMPLDIECGGITVMHNLAKLINDLNHPRYYAKLFIYNNLKYKNFFCNDFARLDEINDNTIVIYPEIITGNPLGAKHVIRWILLNLGIEMPLNHYTKWNKDDIVYVWDKETNNINLKQLASPWLNPIFWKKNNSRLRNKTCFLVKKARLYKNFKKIKFFHEKNSIDINNKSLKDIVNIFNQCKFFYCYDLNTAFVHYAILCGCIPIIYPYKDYSKESWLSGTMSNKNGILYTKGIAWGKSAKEINNAKNTLNQAANEIYYLYNSYNNDIPEWINDIELYFENKDALTNTVKNIYY